MATADKPKADVLKIFLSKTGYAEKDVLSYNERTRLFVTANGGKYQLARNGAVRRLKGPNYPKHTPEE